MTYIKLEQAHTDDERWIEAGADAFAIHVAALVYCDRQLHDGRISRSMALRVSLAVPPERAEAAIQELVKRGFWLEVADGFEIVDYHEHAFPAEQVKRTRERWKVDKERRRQHSIGDHSLCKDPKFCPAIRSTVESSEDSTSGGSHLYPTQSDQTRPDRRSGSGNGSADRTDADAPSVRVMQLATRPCPHGNERGLIYKDDGHVRCPECDQVAPIKHTFPEWRRSVEENGNSDSLVQVIASASEEDCSFTESVCTPLYVQMGGKLTADTTDAVDEDLWSFLCAYVLLGLVDHPNAQPTRRRTA